MKHLVSGADVRPSDRGRLDSLTGSDAGDNKQTNQAGFLAYDRGSRRWHADLKLMPWLAPMLQLSYTYLLSFLPARSETLS